MYKGLAGLEFATNASNLSTGANRISERDSVSSLMGLLSVAEGEFKPLVGVGGRKFGVLKLTMKKMSYWWRK